MTEGAWVAIMTGLPATIAAIGALIVALRNGTQVKANTAAVNEVHKATNGMRAELVAAASAAGIVQGALDERTRLGVVLPTTPPPPPLVDPVAQQRALWIAEGIRQERARQADVAPPQRESPL